MSDQKGAQPRPADEKQPSDPLELDKETLKDLEVGGVDVRGGATPRISIVITMCGCQTQLCP